MSTRDFTVNRSRTAPSLMVRRAVLAAGAGVPLCAAVAAVVGEPRGASAASAALGAGLAGIAMVGGAKGVQWLLSQPGALVLPGGMMIFFVVIVLMLSAAIVLQYLGWVQDVPFALSALAAALLTQAAMVSGYLAARHPVLDPTPAAPEGDR